MQLLGLNGITSWNALRSDLRGNTEADVKELFALLRSMLIIDATRRPSAEEVLKHPWFSHDDTGLS